jgi:molecular chaperone Hsp33
MSDEDLLHRFTFNDLGLRGEFVRLGASWRAVREQHAYPLAVARQLGEGLAAVLLLSCTIKFRGALILQVRGDGPLHTLVAQASEQRTVRGMARWRGEVPETGLGDVFGDGRLVMTAEAPGGERYQGIVALEGADLSDALDRYFLQSEQLGTRLWLRAGSDSIAGLLLQRLPGGRSPDADAWNRVCQLADTVSNREMLDLGVHDLLRRLFHEEAVRVYEPEPVAFRCSCSRERVAGTLRALGREEMETLLAEEGEIVVDCEFCNRRYAFDAVDLEQLLTAAIAPVESKERH